MARYNTNREFCKSFGTSEIYFTQIFTFNHSEKFLQNANKYLYMGCVQSFLQRSFLKKFYLLSFFPIEIHRKQQSLLNIFSIIFITMAHSTIIDVFHFKYGKDHQYKLTKICYYHSCSASNVHLFKKIKIISSAYAEIMRDKKCRKTSAVPGISYLIIS